MTELSPTSGPLARQHTQASSDVHRRVSVAGSGGVSATVVVVARRGQVWVSIMPPFTWEAILEPIKVDELIRTLELAQEDAKKMTRASEKRASVTNLSGCEGATRVLGPAHRENRERPADSSGG